MALYHYVLATSLLLCSLLAIANAGGEYGSQSQPSYEYDHSSIKAPKAEETKPEENVTYPDNTNAPKPSSDDKEKKYYVPVENEEKKTGGEYESQSKEKKNENETYKQRNSDYSSTEAPKVEETKSEDKATYPVSYAPKPSTDNENMKNYAPTKKEEQKNGGEYEQSETSHDQYDHSSWLKLKVEVKPTQYEENKKEKETYKQTDDGYSSTEAPKDEEKKAEEKVTYPVNHAPKPSTDDKEKKYYAPVEKEEKKTNDNHYESQSEEKKKEKETYKQTDSSYGSTDAAKTKETKPEEKMTYPTSSYASKPNIDNKEKKDYAPVEKEEKKNGGDYVSQSEEKKKEKETYKQMDNGYISTEGPKAKETKQEENMTYPATSYSLKPNTDDKEKKNYVPVEKEEKKNGGDYVSQSEEKKKEKETYKQMDNGYISTEGPKAKETKQEENMTYPATSYSLKPNTDDKEKKNYVPVEKEEKKTSYGSTQTESVKRATCEGIVLCKTGKNTFDAIKGAIVKITCETVNEYGYEILPAATYISKTNNDGYFLVPIPRLLKLDQSKYSKYTSCKAEIEHSSTEKCKIPFNGDKWKSSSTYLSSYRILHDRQVKLYSVGPFVFTQEQEQQHTATPTGY
ncbi:hypothetical protein ACFE04_009552 [Oxalis oulophora]